MPFSIEQHHVLAFDDNVMMVFQQEASRLRECVDVRTGIIGKSKSFNRIGKVEASTKGSRDEAHSHQNPDHEVRWANLVYYYNSIALDPDDDDRVLANPKNRYVTTIAGALGRKLDGIIYAALVGTAITGEDRSGTQALPSAQKVAAASSDLTVDKLRSAKKILDANDVPDSERYLAINAQGLQDLLEETETTSSDFNTIRALVNGELNSFLGFMFKRTEQVASGKAVAWHKSALGLAISRDRNIRIAQRHDRHDQWEAYGGMDFGAVRVEDEGVVEISYV